MFRPIPEPLLFRKIPYRLLASFLLIIVLVVIGVLLFSLEGRQTLLGIAGHRPASTEPGRSLWESHDLMVMALLVLLVGTVGTAAVIAFLHYGSTKRTLEEVKGLARNILRSIPTGVLTLNQGGVITAVNPTAEAILHRTADELLGHSYESAFTGDGTIRTVLEGALRAHHLSQKDLPHERPAGRMRTIRVSTVELRGEDGRPAGVLLQAQDMTEWLALEQRLRVAEKLSALHTLSAGMAHELRNPLGAMDLNLHLLEEELKEEGGASVKAAHYLQVLNAECRRLSVILDNVMQFARPGSLGLQEVDLQRVIEHIVALMQFEADERNIKLQYTVDKGLSPVLGDETQISQVLVNIVVNAFQAMEGGGSCILAATSESADGKRWLDISVRDTGPGIPEEVVPRLFEPFYTTKAGGSGLGLAIAYRIMEDHGGSISVSSAPAAGTLVRLRFPAAAGDRHALEAAS